MFLSDSGDDLEKDWVFWKDYRKQLTNMLKEKEQQERFAKTSQNIYDMVQKIGIKPTARYFNMQPCHVRYYLKKYEKEIHNN